MARPDTQIPAVTLYSSQNEIKSSFDIATKSWLCRTCGCEFNLLESMGGLDCYQHPGYIQNDERWSCCGQKIYPLRYLPSRDIQRMYVSKTPPPEPMKVRGCQKCDHNTSNKPFSHKDQQSIASLSAILPFMNKAFPFPLRKGFDQGILRRCEVRKLHLPVNQEGATVYYQDDDGNEQEIVVQNPPQQHLNGMELKAVSKNGEEICKWW
jgi:hypothetical protein